MPVLPLVITPFANSTPLVHSSSLFVTVSLDHPFAEEEGESSSSLDGLDAAIVHDSTARDLLMCPDSAVRVLRALRETF